MNTRLTLTIAAAALCLFATSAGAAVINTGLTPQIGVMKDATGTNPITEGTLVLIHDVEGDGLGEVGTTNSYLTTDDDDVLITNRQTGNSLLPINNAFGFEGAYSDTFTFDTENTGQIFFVFFNNVFEEAQDAPGVGVEFGIVPATFQMPENGGGNFDFGWTTTELFGTQDPETLHADDGVVIPEPASLALLGAGGLLLASSRRRRQ